MRKTFLTMLFIITSMFVFIPVQTKALVISDGISVGTKATDISNWGSNYNQDQNCTGKDSLLGDPNDEDSVAWLLDKILTYTTIAGMLLVVVLSSIDFLKVITKSDDEAMAKAAKKLALRLVFAALLFFVPTLTNALLDIFGLTSASTCGIQQ